jgi:hypothetical protein
MRSVVMKSCAATPVFLVAFCACLSAQARPTTPGTEVNRAVGSVDASVHAEVDGQPHEPSAAELSSKRVVPSPSAEQSRISAFGPVRAEASSPGTGGKADPLRFGIFSVDPGTGVETPASWQTNLFTTSAGDNDDSTHSLRRMSATPVHPLHGGGTSSSSLRGIVSTVPPSDETRGLSSPFSRTALVSDGTANPFQKRDVPHRNDQAVKRHRQRRQKSATSVGTKSSVDSSATQH